MSNSETIQFNTLTNALSSALIAGALDDAMIADAMRPHLEHIDALPWDIRDGDDRLDELNTRVHVKIADWMLRHEDKSVREQGENLLWNIAEGTKSRECCESCWWASIEYAKSHAEKDLAGALERLYVAKHCAPIGPMIEARIQLAKIWATGLGGVPVDLDAAESEISAARESDDGEGAYRLGTHFDEPSDGVESSSPQPDLQLAADFYNLAAEFGHAKARQRLGTLIVQDRVQGYQRSEGLRLLGKPGHDRKRKTTNRRAGCKA